MNDHTFVGRAGYKLAFALDQFSLNPTGLICADFGSAVGGFVDCLLQYGATKVYAVETGYGVLDYRLRVNPKVVTLERTNAMHVKLPEKVSLITIDTSWTKQQKVIPNALDNLSPRGHLISLIKPHYEIGIAKLSADESSGIFKKTLDSIAQIPSLKILSTCQSPLTGSKGENVEYLVYLEKI